MNMNILIVGGTGMIGGHAAQHLLARGHAVTLGARKPAAAGTPMEKMPVLIGDYTEGGFSPADLAEFDAVVFAAGNDIRHITADDDEAAFWDKTQIRGVPEFAEKVRAAGVSRFVQLGSYYHHLRPDIAETDAYVRARMLADEGARALATEGFNVSTLNPPSIVGAIPGIVAKRYQMLAAWGRGEMPEIGAWAPPGGTNYMSVRSLAQAIEGALLKAESGKAYLIGDESLSYRDFFQLVFDAVGSDVTLEVRDENHPLLPDRFIVQGRGNVLAYEPDPAETALLGYTRHDVARAVREVVDMAGASA